MTIEPTAPLEWGEHPRLGEVVPLRPGVRAPTVAVDPVTALPGRVEVERVLEQAASDEIAASVVFVDVDHFKRVNDPQGRQAGGPRHRALVAVGLALAGIFSTCAITHFVCAVDTASDVHVLVFDLWGVPASVYFLVVVRALYRESLTDWNARPAVGHRLGTARPAPGIRITPVRRRGALS